MKKILVANRGEIAIRIAKSAKDLGLKVVGIYSEDDIDSLHISKMDFNDCLIHLDSFFIRYIATICESLE